MNLGTSEKRHDSELNNYDKTDIVYLKDGMNIHRVIQGPFPIRIGFYPGLIFDEDKQEDRAINMPFCVPKNSMFDKLASLDLKIRKELGEDVSKFKSPLKPIQRFAYIIFDRAGDELKKQVAMYPWSVADKLRKLQVQTDPLNPEKLKNCLLFMQDVCITRGKSNNPAKASAPGGGIEYDASFITPNRFESKMPISYSNMTDEDIIEKFTAQGLWESIFTPEELKLVNEPFDIAPYIHALEDEEILEKLEDVKFNIEAKAYNGGSLFPAKQEFLRALQSIDYGFALSSVDQPAGLLNDVPVPSETATTVDEPIINEGDIVDESDEVNWSQSDTKEDLGFDFGKDIEFKE